MGSRHRDLEMHPTISIFVDTNTFIHLRDIADLPWHQLLPDHFWIEIVVASIVIEELDKKKDDRSNSRVRDRSRLALGLIKQATISPGNRLVLKESPRLSIRPDDSTTPDWAAFPKLSRLSSDDQLVISTIHHSANSVLFSRDTGPLIRARLNGLQALEPPNDWLLPPQEDEAKKEIQRLQRELLEERGQRPIFRIAFIDEVGASRSRVTVRVPDLKPLTHDQCARLTELSVARNAMVELRRSFGTDAMKEIMTRQIGYNNSDVDAYSAEYNCYKTRLRHYYGNLHTAVINTLSIIRLRAKVENNSAFAGSNVIAQLTASHHLRFTPEDNDIGVLPNLLPPLPPEPPPMFPGGISWMPQHHNADDKNGYDPTTFRRRRGARQSEQDYSLICDEFRARDEKVETFSVILPHASCDATVKLRVSGSSGEPATADLLLQVELVPTQWREDTILRVLDANVANDIRSM